MVELIVACVLALAEPDPPPVAATPVAAAPVAAAPVVATPVVTTPLETSPPDMPPILGVNEPMSVNVDVGVWIARLTGTAMVGAGGTTFQLNHDLAVGGMEAGLAGEFGVWCGRWRFGGVGFSTSITDTSTAGKTGTFGTTAMTQGDPISGHMTAWMVGAEAGYTVWRPFADEPWPWSDSGANREQATKAIGKNGHPLIDMRFLALAGGLIMGYDQSVQNLLTGSQSDFSKTVGAVYGGAGAEINMGMDGRVPLLQDIRIYAYAGLGPSIPDADIVCMVRVGIAAMFNDNLGVEFGYRLFDFDLQDGPSEVDGGIRGMFAAVTLKF